MGTTKMVQALGLGLGSQEPQELPEAQGPAVAPPAPFQRVGQSQLWKGWMQLVVLHWLAQPPSTS